MEMKRREFVTYGMAATAAAILAGCSKKEIDAAVVKDLQTAYNGESNAQAKYTMYAEECAKAGYLSIATLYKAASFAESIHKANHAKVLAKYGAEISADIKLPTWVDVATALKDSIKGETYEFSEMYPAMVKTATDKKMADAIRTFSTALKAEVIHAKFYQDALDHMDAWKAAGKKFYICSVCGFTTDDASVATCPYCAAPKSKFKEFA